MNAALDIGNTRTKIGLFQENRLLEQAIWTDWTLQELCSFVERRNVENIIVSSVAKPETGMLETLGAQVRVLELTHETPLPFRNAYRTPHTLGKDRLAGVAGAQVLYPGRDCLIIDCGTCIKYEILARDGTYAGGNIAPGAEMRIKAMHHFTARLPEVDLEMPDEPIGISTETALQNGALLGAVLEMAGFARLFRNQMPDLQIVMTGGDAAFFKPYVELHTGKTDLEPNLTLHGLNRILIMNYEL
jgi:type III pantothenate kinase